MACPPPSGCSRRSWAAAGAGVRGRQRQPAADVRYHLQGLYPWPAPQRAPWCREPVVKFLCPAPGYDRHFKVTESFGFELVTIPMTDEGPDMDAVERPSRTRRSRAWDVPKYNPDGIIYSGPRPSGASPLEARRPDFLLMWDNAYCIHEFEGDYGSSRTSWRSVKNTATPTWCSSSPPPPR
ncbi:MAG: hypothetical protein ACLTYN_09435 [Dysosmobacter welbionis]